MPDVSSCHANRDADLAVGEATLEARVHGSRLDNPGDLSPGRLVAGPQTSFRILDQLTQGREGGTGKGCKKSLERSHDAPDLSHLAKQGKPHPPASGCRKQGAVPAIASSAVSLRPPSASLRFWDRAPEAPQDGVVVESLDVGIFKALAGTDGGREGAAVLVAVDRPD